MPAISGILDEKSEYSWIGFYSFVILYCLVGVIYLIFISYEFHGNVFLYTVYKILLGFSCNILAKFITFIKLKGELTNETNEKKIIDRIVMRSVVYG